MKKLVPYALMKTEPVDSEAESGTKSEGTPFLEAKSVLKAEAGPKSVLKADAGPQSEAAPLKQKLVIVSGLEGTIASGDKLSDLHMSYAQHLLQRHFPGLKGL